MLARLVSRSLRGELSPGDLAKYAYVLKILADLISVEDVEKRLAALEKRFLGQI
jgi:hypothetical protein